MTDGYTDHAVAEQTVSVLYARVLQVVIPIIINYHIIAAHRRTQLLRKTGHLHTLSGNEHHAESQQTRSTGRSLLSHFLQPFTAHVWLNSSWHTHTLYFSLCQNKTSQHISKVQENNSGATNALLL